MERTILITFYEYLSTNRCLTSDADTDGHMFRMVDNFLTSHGDMFVEPDRSEDIEVVRNRVRQIAEEYRNKHYRLNCLTH